MATFLDETSSREKVASNTSTMSSDGEDGNADSRYVSIYAINKEDIDLDDDTVREVNPDIVRNNNASEELIEMVKYKKPFDEIKEYIKGIEEKRNGEKIPELTFDMNARDKLGRTAAHYACINGQPEIIDYLVSRYKPRLNFRDLGGFAAVHLAAKHGQASCIRSLMAAGIDVLLTDDFNNQTALIIAVRSGFKDCVLALLDEEMSQVTNVAMLRMKNRRGITALHVAAQNGDYSMCELLVGAGGDLSARTTAGLTPEDMALESDFAEMSQKLKMLAISTEDRFKAMDSREESSGGAVETEEPLYSTTMITEILTSIDEDMDVEAVLADEGSKTQVGFADIPEENEQEMDRKKKEAMATKNLTQMKKLTAALDVAVANHQVVKSQQDVCYTTEIFGVFSPKVIDFNHTSQILQSLMVNMQTSAYRLEIWVHPDFGVAGIQISWDVEGTIVESPKSQCTEFTLGDLPSTIIDLELEEHIVAVCGRFNPDGIQALEITTSKKKTHSCAADVVPLNSRSFVYVAPAEYRILGFVGTFNERCLTHVGFIVNATNGIPLMLALPPMQHRINTAMKLDSIVPHRQRDLPKKWIEPMQYIYAFTAKPDADRFQKRVARMVSMLGMNCYFWNQGLEEIYLDNYVKLRDVTKKRMKNATCYVIYLTLFLLQNPTCLSIVQDMKSFMGFGDKVLIIYEPEVPDPVVDNWLFDLRLMDAQAISLTGNYVINAISFWLDSMGMNRIVDASVHRRRSAGGSQLMSEGMAEKLAMMVIPGRQNTRSQESQESVFDSIEGHLRMPARSRMVSRRLSAAAQSSQGGSESRSLGGIAGDLRGHQHDQKDNDETVLEYNIAEADQGDVMFSTVKEEVAELEDEPDTLAAEEEEESVHHLELSRIPSKERTQSLPSMVSSESVSDRRGVLSVGDVSDDDLDDFEFDFDI